MKNLILLICSMCLVHCASIHTGPIGQTLSDNKNFPLKISAEEIDGTQHESFQLIYLTLENLSEDWINVENMEVVIAPENQKEVSVVKGKELLDWRLAYAEKKKREQFNGDMAKLALLGIGTAALLGGHGNSNLQSAGAIALLATEGAIAAEEIVDAKHKAERSPKEPENYISNDVTIPGKMYQRKWVVIKKSSNKRIDKLVIKVAAKNYNPELIAINLKYW